MLNAKHFVDNFGAFLVTENVVSVEVRICFYTHLKFPENLLLGS
jgi:hypothetical protein